MKTAIICAICEKPKRESDSYSVKLTDYRLKNAIEYNLPNTNIKDKLSLVFKVKVCRGCAKRMGYKIKVKKSYLQRTVINLQSQSIEGNARIAPRVAKLP